MHWEFAQETASVPLRGACFVILNSWAFFFYSQENFRHFSFLIFMGSLYTSGFIIYFFLPETKKKSILEIREEFDKLNFKKKQIPILEAKLTKDHELCTKL